tara:strand:+ start:256780 stop:256935 length:156 start_codon:yes stop_codon:yes gene_type:complete
VNAETVTKAERVTGEAIRSNLRLDFLEFCLAGIRHLSKRTFAAHSEIVDAA